MQATPEPQSATLPASVSGLSLLRRFAQATEEAIVFHAQGLITDGNGALGQQAGDRLLCEVAGRLSALLRRLGCSHFQGYLASRPMAVGAMERFWRPAAGTWGRR